MFVAMKLFAAIFLVTLLMMAATVSQACSEYSSYYLLVCVVLSPFISE